MKNLNSKEQTKLALTDKLSHFFGVSVEDATYEQVYKATAMIIKEQMNFCRHDFIKVS